MEQGAPNPLRRRVAAPTTTFPAPSKTAAPAWRRWLVRFAAVVGPGMIVAFADTEVGAAVIALPLF